jgi:uroporphyrinogen decarboxylase
MNDRLLRALRREPVDATPVWFMRQAGRSLPRYRELRAERAMYALLRDPPAAAEITALPLEYYDVDAAVLYNDLSTPYFAAGFDVELRVGVGPVVTNPIRAPADVARLRPFEPRTALDYTLAQIRLLTQRLKVPVLGFVGAPFTLCTYLLDAPRSREQAPLKAFIWRTPDAWHELADFWATHMAAYGIAQHEAGAAAVQVFDSWAGALSVEDYARYVQPHTHKLLGLLAAAGVPTINFALGNPALLPLVAEAGGDAISVDWRQPLDEAWRSIGTDRAIQGNLDPAVLLAGEQVAIAHVRTILESVRGRPGHIFNCGHGLLPDTDHNVARAVVDFVHEFTAHG